MTATARRVGIRLREASEARDLVGCAAAAGDSEAEVELWLCCLHGAAHALAGSGADAAAAAADAAEAAIGRAEAARPARLRAWLSAHGRLRPFRRGFGGALAASSLDQETVRLALATGVRSTAVVTAS